MNEHLLVLLDSYKLVNTEFFQHVLQSLKLLIILRVNNDNKDSCHIINFTSVKEKYKNKNNIWAKLLIAALCILEKENHN